MMLVNNGSGPQTYGPLLHASWHGWTFTDTVFPFFLWISGVSMTFSFAKRVKAGDDKHKLMLHTLRRAAVIFLLGLLLTAYPFYTLNLSTLRIPGVLQRIAVCYLFGGMIFLYCSRRMQAVIAAGCLIVYWALMTFVPVPGFGAGVLEKEGNLEQYIDSMFLTGHMYRATRIYDPEGILSTIPAIGTILAGILTGHLLRSRRLPPLEKLAWMFFSGNVCILAGLWWGLLFPINKNIWTSSFALLMAGLALAVFGSFYWLVDIKGWKKWAHPLVIYGSNAIAVYVMAGIIAKSVGLLKIGKPMYDFFASFASPPNASLLYASCYVLGLYLIAWGLYRKGWFLKV